ncbi:MAG: hypothetical protein U0J92_08525 [Prevotellamassilia sp.]|nr:hypothetical protein [Prevotellamassilia sp.]
MKCTFLVLFAALTLGSTLTVQARDKKTDGDSKERLTKQATRMASELKLDDKTQAWFIPLYAEYQDTLRSLRRPVEMRVQSKKGKACKQGLASDANSQAPDVKGKTPQAKLGRLQLTDAEALQRIEENFSRTEREVALKRVYMARFQEKLTPQQLFVIFCRSSMQQRSQKGRPQGGMQGGGRPMGGFGGPQGGMQGGFGGDF